MSTDHFYKLLQDYVSSRFQNSQVQSYNTFIDCDEMMYDVSYKILTDIDNYGKIIVGVDDLLGFMYSKML